MSVGCGGIDACLKVSVPFMFGELSMPYCCAAKSIKKLAGACEESEFALVQIGCESVEKVNVYQPFGRRIRNAHIAWLEDVFEVDLQHERPLKERM